jgi:hypothetical protein
LELLPCEIELVAQVLALFFPELVEFGVHFPQTSVGPMSDGRYHFQIAQQFLKRGGRRGLSFPFAPSKTTAVVEET